MTVHRILVLGLFAALCGHSALGAERVLSEPELKAIEVAVDERLKELRPRLIEDAAASLMAKVSAEPSPAGGAGDSITAPRSSTAVVEGGSGSSAIPLHATQGPRDRGAYGEGVQFEISAGQQNSRATISMSRMSSCTIGQASTEEERKHCANPRSGNDALVSTTEAWSVSAPAEKEGPTNIATLDGFKDASELKYERTVWRAEGNLDPAGRDPKRLRSFCDEVGLEPKNCETEAVWKALDEQGKTELARQFDAFMHDKGMRIWSWGHEFKVGHRDFEYFGPDLSKRDTSAIYWGGGLHYAWIPKGKRLLLEVGTDLQRAYSAAKTMTACAVIDQPVLTCVTGSLSAPAEKMKHLVYVEARGPLPKPSWLPGPQGDMGVSLRVTHDLRNNQTGVDLPLYLIRTKDGGFTGGVRLGWTSTDQFGIGVFVGSSLKTFD